MKAKDQATKRLNQTIEGTSGELVEQMQMEINEKDKIMSSTSDPSGDLVRELQAKLSNVERDLNDTENQRNLCKRKIHA